LTVALSVSRNVPATFLQLPHISYTRIQNTQINLRSTAQIIANAFHNGVHDELFGLCKR
jgi:hypothetical protein